MARQPVELRADLAELGEHRFFVAALLVAAVGARGTRKVEDVRACSRPGNRRLQYLAQLVDLAFADHPGRLQHRQRGLQVRGAAPAVATPLGRTAALRA